MRAHGTADAPTLYRASVADAPLPAQTYRSGARQTTRQALTDLWHARDVMRAFAVRGVRVRYRQAFLGVAWALIQPVALLVPISLFLSDQTPRIDGVRFAASTLAALVSWTYLSSAVTAGSGALVAEAVLVRKTWFPREAPVVAAAGAAALELIIGVAMAVIAAPMLGGTLGISLVSLPVVAGSLLIVAATLSIPFAAANALYRDVRHALPFVVLLWLFASPVMYPATRVNPSARPWYALFNPAVGPVESLRRVVAHGEWPPWTLLGSSMFGALLIGAVGHHLFRRIAPTLADVV